MTSSLKGEGGVGQKMTCDDMMTRGGGKGLMTKYPLLTEILGKARVTLIVPGCQPGWEEMEHFRGNLGENNSEKSQPGRKPHN